VSFIGGADCSEAEDQQVPLLNCKSDLFCFFFWRQKKRREEKNSTFATIKDQKCQIYFQN